MKEMSREGDASWSHRDPGIEGAVSTTTWTEPTEHPVQFIAGEK